MHVQRSQFLKINKFKQSHANSIYNTTEIITVSVLICLGELLDRNSWNQIKVSIKSTSIKKFTN